MDVADQLCRTHPDLHALLAGPVAEPSLAAVIKVRLLGAAWLKYLCPVYGDAKSRLYSDIDAFVFPRRHPYEADPRVLNEALAYGVTIVALGRGCIALGIGDGGGVVIADDLDFVSEADKLLQEWYDESSLFSSISSATLANSARIESDHIPRLTALIREMVSRLEPPEADPQPGDQT